MKKLNLIICICGLVVLLFTTQVHAIIVDVPDTGGPGFFRDTETGHTWMDVDNFLNLRDREDYVTALFGTGFHLANLSEVLELQQSIPLNPTSFDAHFDIMGGSFNPSGVPGGVCTASLPGGAGICPPPPEPTRVITGYYDDEGGGEGLSLSFWHETENEWRFRNFDGFVFGGEPNQGAFVVNSVREPVVPEPSTVLLLGSGLFAAFVRRRNQKA